MNGYAGGKNGSEGRVVEFTQVVKVVELGKGERHFCPGLQRVYRCDVVNCRLPYVESQPATHQAAEINCVERWVYTR